MNLFIILAKLVTYYSYNYAGMIGAGLHTESRDYYEKS